MIGSFFNASYLPQAQETADLLKQEQIAGAGAQPVNYLQTEVSIQLPDNMLSADSITVSSSAVSPSPAAVDGTGTLPERVQYLENSHLYAAMVDGGRTSAPASPPPAPASPPPAPPSPNGTSGTGGSGGVESTTQPLQSGAPSGVAPTGHSSGGDGIDQVNGLQQGLDDDTTSFMEQNYSTTDANGYLVPDTDKLEAWAKSILARANILFSLLLAMTNMYDLKKIVVQAFTDIPIEPSGKYSYKKIFAQKFQSYQKIVQTAVSSLFSYINTKNNELYQKRIDAIQASNSGTWNKIHDKCSGGRGSDKVTEAALKEGQHYLQATKDALKQMQSVLDDIAEYMKDLAGDGKGNVFALGMYGFIKEFDKQVDLLNKKIDDKMTDINNALAQIDDQGGGFLGGIGDFCSDLVHGRFGKLGGDLEEIGTSLKQLGNDIIHGNWKGICTWAGNELDVLNRFQDSIWRGIFGDDFGGFMSNACGIGLDLGQVGLTLAKDPIGSVCKLVKLIIFNLLGWIVGKLIISYILGGIAAGLTSIFSVNAGTKVFNAMGKAGDATYAADKTAGDYVIDKGIIHGIAWAVKNTIGRLDYGPVVVFIVGCLTGDLTLACLMQVQEKVKFGDDYIRLDISGLLEKYRGGLTGMENGYRMFLSLEMMPRDLRDTVRQKLTGLTNVESDAEIIMASAESAMSLASSFMDITASELMLEAGLHNQTVQLAESYIRTHEAEQMRALAVLCTVAAIVIGVIVSCATFGGGTVPYTLAVVGAVAGLAAAAANAAAQEIASDVPAYDALPPDQGMPDDNSSESVGQSARDPFEALDRQQQTNERLAAKSETFYSRNKDGFYSFDAKAFAAFELRETMIANAIRSVLSVLKGGRDLVRVVDAELSGSATIDSGEALLQNAVENILGQRQVMLSAIKYMHQQVIAAKNLARQSQLAEEKAMGLFASSSVGAGIGALIGACFGGAGVFVGMGIGSALASSAYTYFWLEFSSDSALGASFDSKNRELEAELRKQGGDSVEAKLDKAEADAYEDMLANGIVGTGDGYYGVNFPLITAAYSKIGAIYTAKEALAKVRSLASELRSIVKQEMGGAIDPTVGDLTESVNRASFGTALKVMQDIVSFNQSRVQVKNRARDAQKQALMAGIGFGINVALSAVGFSCMSIAPAVSSLASAAMGLSNSVISLVSHLTAMETGEGAYQGYDAKTTVDKTGRRSKNSPDVDGKLDDLEAEIMSEMNTSLITTIDGSMQGVSPQASILSWRLKAIYNIKECIAIARSSASASKAMVGGKGSSDYGRSFIEQYQSLALSMLDSMKQSLEVIAQRHNQISEEEKGAILAGIGVGLSALSMACSIAATVKAAEVPNDTSPAVSPTNPANASQTTAAATLSEPAPQTPAQSTTPSAAPNEPAAASPTTATAPTTQSPAAADQTTAAASTSTPAPAAAPNKPAPAQATAPSSSSGSQDASKVDVLRANNNKMKENPNAKEAVTWRRAAEYLNMGAIIVNLLADTIYDAVAYSNGHKASAPQAGKGLDPHKSAQSGKAGSGKSASTSEGGGGDIYGSLDNMDFETAIAEQNISIFESSDQSRAYAAARHERIADSLLAGLRQISSLIDSYRTPKEQNLAVSPKDEADKLAAAMINKKPEAQATLILAKEKEEPQSMVKLMASDKGTMATAVKVRDALALTDPNRAALSALISTAQQRITQTPVKSASADKPALANQKGNMDRADQIEKQIQAKNEIADKYVKAGTNIKNEVEDLEKDYKVVAADTVKLTEQVEGLEKEAKTTADPLRKEAIKAEIKDLEAQKNGLQLKLGKLTAELQKTKDGLDALKASKPTALNSIKAEKTAYKKELADVSQEIERITQSGTPEQQATLPALQAKVKTLQAKISMCEAALDQVDDPQPIEDAENGIKQLKEQIKVTRGEISKLGTRINKLQGQLLRLEKGETRDDNKRTVKAGSVVTSGKKVESPILEVLAGGNGGEGQSQDGGNGSSSGGGQNNGKNGKQGGKQSFMSLLFGDGQSAPSVPTTPHVNTGSGLRDGSYRQQFERARDEQAIFSRQA